jgi:sigma-E factor negative regulatory protein RseA
MSKESREHLSCLMDGEISRETGRFLVRRLGADRELRDTWARYHLLRDCLRHQEGELVAHDLCSKVQQALAGEAPQAAPRRFATAWLKPVAGVAVAASVALMAVFAVGPGQNPGSTLPGDTAGSQQAEVFVSPKNVLTRSPRTQQVSVMGGLRADQKMNSYLLRHYQVTGSTGGKGFVTYIPMVVTLASPKPDAQDTTEEDKDKVSANQDHGSDSTHQ